MHQISHCEFFISNSTDEFRSAFLPIPSKPLLIMSTRESARDQYSDGTGSRCGRAIDGNWYLRGSNSTAHSKDMEYMMRIEHSAVISGEMVITEHYRACVAMGVHSPQVSCMRRVYTRCPASGYQFSFWSWFSDITVAFMIAQMIIFKPPHSFLSYDFLLHSMALVYILPALAIIDEATFYNAKTMACLLLPLHISLEHVLIMKYKRSSIF